MELDSKSSILIYHIENSVANQSPHNLEEANEYPLNISEYIAIHKFDSRFLVSIITISLMDFVPAWVNTRLDMLTGAKKISASVVPMENIFDTNVDGMEFFHSVSDFFRSFDQSNNLYCNQNFSNDVWYLISCTSKSLDSRHVPDQFSNRIDSYFYIYRQIAEYLNKIDGRPIKEKRSKELKQLRTSLYRELRNVFQKTLGENPNVQITDRDTLRRINIREHLLVFRTISHTEDLLTFFVLSKLSWQSSLNCEDHLSYSWSSILSQVQSIGVPLEEVVSTYIDYKQTFAAFPIDILGFISLISKIPCSKKSEKAPFSSYVSCLHDLNLDEKKFFDEYLPCLPDWLAKNKSPRRECIGDLLRHVNQWELLFEKYLYDCGRRMREETFWKVVLDLIANVDFTETIVAQMGSILADVSQSLSIEKLSDRIESAMTTREKLKDESFTNLTKILEMVLDSFLLEKLRSEHNQRKIEDRQWINLYDLGRSLSPTQSCLQPSCLSIIKRLLFNFGHATSISEEILLSFKNIGQFNPVICEGNDPKVVIKDEWLRAYTIPLLSLCSILNQSNYHNLCCAHNNHSWKIYFWSRIVYLSILKANTKEPADALFNTVSWMKDVGHDVYKRDDTLTIVFLNSIFETIIMKNIDSILSTPNMEVIINYILVAESDGSHLINKKHVDEFTQKVQQWIKNIFLLRGR